MLGIESKLDTSVNMKADISFTGQKMVAKNLRKVDIKTRRKGREGVLAVGWMIHNDAKYMCPIDTGRLRASTSVNWSGSGLNVGKTQSPAKTEDGVGNPGQKLFWFWVVVGTNVEYAEKVDKFSAPYLTGAYIMNKSKFMAVVGAMTKQGLRGAL